MISTWSTRQLKKLRESQDDVVRRSQLVACGISYATIEAQVAATRWKELGPVLIVLHNGPLTRVQELWAAVLNGGKLAALAGRTAAIEGGLTGWSSVGVEILVQRGTTVEPLPGVELVVHESRRFDRVDIHPALKPARTRMERSLVDAATWTKDVRAACGLLCAGVQQQLTTAAKLSDALSSAGQVRHRRLLTATLDDIAGGAQALSEIDFTRLVRRYRLPVTVERQTMRVTKDGRRRYLDVTLRSRSGRRLHVEIDGAVHLLPRRYWDDMLRQNEMVIAGEPVLRFPSISLRLDEALVIDQVCRALGLPRADLAA